MKKYEVVVPVIPQDFIRCKNNYVLMEKHLPIKKIVFIGPEELKSEIEALSETECKKQFINENDIIPFSEVNSAIKNRVEREGYTVAGNSRPGWYYQQFLKMQYSYMCEDEYYMVWDSDTIPIKDIDVCNAKGKPYLDVKIEHNQPYFDTINTLFSDIGKVIDFSFISEHMLFKTEKMRELINVIEGTNLIGDKFYEKIFSAIALNNLKLGFSEFETYGTYITVNYPEEYEIRRWYSMRSAGCFFEADKLTENDIEWLSKDFHAISFEKNNTVVPMLYEMFHNENYRKLLTPMQIYLKVQESGIFSGMKDG